MRVRLLCLGRRARRGYEVDDGCVFESLYWVCGLFVAWLGVVYLGGRKIE
jgi:hypothetical protein